MKKKIGIITHYYLSSNFGGILQAYALVKYLNNRGYEAVQITYNLYKKEVNINRSLKKTNNSYIRKISKKIKNAVIKLNNQIHGVGNLRTVRRDACKKFREAIPHTEKIYDWSNIDECNSKFDVFITGSDQVWNPERYRQEFFLSFVDGIKKVKMSYAASISNSLANSYVKKIYKDNLRTFKTISVREKSDVKVIEEITNEPIYWVLDPVFLLPRMEWEKKCEQVSEVASFEYIFCYFLGNGSDERKLVNEFASRHDLKIVTIPYMQMNYRRCDKKFGDVKLNKVNPDQFLWLIKNATYICTDSFHSTAFSIVFNKPFVTFGRKEHPEMNERIDSITDVFSCKDRFIEKVGTQSYCEMEIALNKTMNFNYDKFEKLLEVSEQILEF